ncbi:MAG: ATP-binding protein [Candidatus Cloacimonetes bacterium]|nr:ATP-binding protein [Candidatus Cloacimonadota bacterium]
MIIAIASGKGGTGKTTLAVNLSAFLAEKRKVILADLDVEEPNSGIFLKGRQVHSEKICRMIPEWIERTCIMCGKCQELCRFNAVLKIPDRIMLFPELCHSCFACSELCPTSSLPMHGETGGILYHSIISKKLQLVDSHLEIGQVSAVPLISATISYLKGIAASDDLLIFDSPPGTSCPMLEVTKSAEHVILVTEPTPFGFHDLKLAIKTMEKLDKSFSIVLNQAGDEFDSTIIEFCHSANYRIIACIPYMRRAAELYSAGRLLYQEIPVIREALSVIANNLQLA